MNSDSVNVLAVGSKVLIGVNKRKDIPATITGVLIRDSKYITYECSWWDGRNRRLEWLWDYEVNPETSDKMVVGFKKEVN